MLNRRHFLAATAAMTTLRALPVLAEVKQTLQVYIDGDTNISNWWNDSIKPAFEAANPGMTFKAVCL